MSTITQSQAIQYATNYRGAKASLQWSIRWAVEQTLNGNADGLFIIMNAAGMIANKEGVMTTLADGRQLWKYLTAPIDDGGLGLSHLIRWSTDDNKFKMTNGWKAAATKIDVVAIAQNMADCRWDQYKSTPSKSAFDLDKAIMHLVTRAANNGVTEEDVAKAFRKLAKPA